MFKGRTILLNQNNNSKSLFRLRKKNSNFEIIKVAKSEVQFKEEFNYQFALYQRVPGKQVKYQFLFGLLRFGKTTCTLLRQVQLLSLVFYSFFRRLTY